MILDSVTLINFGAYSGRQEAILTPEYDRPIILFGGMNGGGKTTLLDAIQLAFYGQRARLSNRNRLSYRAYLRESIHRGCDPKEGAGIILCFRRMDDGEYHHFELQRQWHEGTKEIEETLSVLRDGKIDNELTEHWDEVIEAYLPNGIAHLFFFDGEQIKELAEGNHTAAILGTAVHSLLGLDLVDRLETDLKVFERRKKAEALDQEATHRLEQARGELERIDSEQGKIAWEEGELSTTIANLEHQLSEKENLFRSEGGELYLRRVDLQNEFEQIKTQKSGLEDKLRDLTTGPIPLLMVDTYLDEMGDIARRETEIRRARALFYALETRDKEVLITLKRTKILKDETIQKITQILEADRSGRRGMAEESLLLDADDNLSSQLSHLRTSVLPAAEKQAYELIAKVTNLEEKSTQLESEIARVPTADRIAAIQLELDTVRNAYESKKDELKALSVRKQTLQRQRDVAQLKMDKISEDEMNIRFAEDDRQRMLKHSLRVRETLGKFRTNIVRRHASNIEALMLESFRKLLRKKDLIKNLAINPSTFETTLTGQNGKALPFDRLSAGEKQLLATSLLWGLARASGRPVPTIIDTPLGRLDSSHRRHLIERYFPNASHQVLLLSTDEEICGTYFSALKPFVARTYLLTHNEETGQSRIEPGYFNV